MNRFVLFFSLGAIVTCVTNAARLVADSPIGKPDTLDWATPVILILLACANWESKP